MPEEDPSRPDPPRIPARHVHPQYEHIRHALGGDDELPIDPDLEPDDARAPSTSHHPHTAESRAARAPWVLVAVFGGGALGTLARYAVEQAWSQPATHFPTTIFLVNTSGAFLLGVVLTMLLERHPSHGRIWRPLLCTGVLGGWTTYSSLVVGADTLAKSGHVVVGAGYVAITLVCGVVAIALGIGLGRARLGSAPGGPPSSSGIAPADAMPADMSGDLSSARREQ